MRRHPLLCLALLLPLLAGTSAAKDAKDDAAAWKALEAMAAKALPGVTVSFRATGHVDGKADDPDAYAGKLKARGKIVCPTEGERLRLPEESLDEPGQMEFYLLTDTDLVRMALLGFPARPDVAGWKADGFRLTQAVAGKTVTIRGERQAKDERAAFELVLVDGRPKTLVRTWKDGAGQSEEQTAFAWTGQGRLKRLKRTGSGKRGKQAQGWSATLEIKAYATEGEHVLPKRFSLRRLDKRPVHVSQKVAITLEHPRIGVPEEDDAAGG